MYERKPEIDPLYTARIPTQLIDVLFEIGLVTRSTTTMGSATGTELRFLPVASTWIAPLFK